MPGGDLIEPAFTRPIIAKHLVHLARLENASVVSPVREWTFSAAELDEYVRARRLPAGSLDGSASARTVAAAPDYPANVEVAFEEGVPVALNGVSLPLVELLSSVETIAGAHGLGRAKSAGALLHDAHRALQSCVTPPDLDRSARDRGADYAGFVASGAWYSSAREHQDAFVASVQKHVTGTAHLKFFKGHSEVVECRSPFALTAIPPTPTTDFVAARS
jgi:argininosuccinate synthase